MQKFIRFCLAILIAIFISPLFLVLCFLVFMLDGGPIFFGAQRVGLKGKNFTLWKFRTMHSGTSNESPLTRPGDSRITSTGHFLRNSKLDESPQIFNVLIGDMAFIGPRPEDPELVRRYYDEYHLRSLDVLPGLFGPGTLYYLKNFNKLSDSDDPVAYYGTTILPPRLKLDIEYEESRTWLSDLNVMAQTVAYLLGRLFNKSLRE